MIVFLYLKSGVARCVFILLREGSRGHSEAGHDQSEGQPNSSCHQQKARQFYLALLLFTYDLNF